MSWLLPFNLFRFLFFFQRNLRRVFFNDNCGIMVESSIFLHTNMRSISHWTWVLLGSWHTPWSYLPNIQYSVLADLDLQYFQRNDILSLGRDLDRCIVFLAPMMRWCSMGLEIKRRNKFIYSNTPSLIKLLAFWSSTCSHLVRKHNLPFY